jgi:hypothetical protein
MLSDALKTLSAPPSGKRIQSTIDANVLHNSKEIAALEKQMGLPPSAFEHRLAMSRARLEVLRQMAGQPPTVASTASAAPVAAAAQAPVARPFEPSGDSMTDRAILAAGCHSLAQYRAKLKADQAFAIATALPQGSISRAAAEKNLGIALAAFRNC